MTMIPLALNPEENHDGISNSVRVIFSEISERYYRHSRHFNDLSRKTRAEVILHLPLESVSGTIPGPGLITSQMTDDHILDLLKRDLYKLIVVVVLECLMFLQSIL